jgi:hypothetical protein
MMGNKTLTTIREEFKAVLAATGDDPIRWLEKRIAAAKRKGEGTNVLEASKRVLERASRKNRVSQGPERRRKKGPARRPAERKASCQPEPR